MPDSEVAAVFNRLVDRRDKRGQDQALQPRSSARIRHRVRASCRLRLAFSIRVGHRALSAGSAGHDTRVRRGISVNRRLRTTRVLRTSINFRNTASLPHAGRRGRRAAASGSGS